MGALKIIRLIALAVLAIGVSLSASAERLDVTNEIINGEFNTDLSSWQYSTNDVAWVPFFGNPPGAVQCDKTVAGWGDTMYQIVDDSTSHYWNPNGHKKVIDLEADISVLLKDGATGGVQFTVGYLGEDYNTVNDRQLLPAVSQQQGTPWNWLTPWNHTSSQSFYFTKVHPYESHLVNEHVAWDRSVVLPVQPRWIVVKVDFWQPNNAINMVDNIWFTSRCIPEPGAMASLAAGLVGMLGLKRFRRK